MSLVCVNQIVAAASTKTMASLWLTLSLTNSGTSRSHFLKILNHVFHHYFWAIIPESRFSVSSVNFFIILSGNNGSNYLNVFVMAVSGCIMTPIKLDAANVMVILCTWWPQPSRSILLVLHGQDARDETSRIFSSELKYFWIAKNSSNSITDRINWQKKLVDRIFT